MLDQFLLAVMIGAVGYGWVEVLTGEGHIFHFVRKYITSSNIPVMVQKPLILCSICCAGQISLWTYIISGMPIGFTDFHIIPFVFTAMMTAYSLDR